MREGLAGVPVGTLREDGEEAVRAGLAGAIERWRPDVIHVMYYNHERLAVMARELAGDDATVVFECRDPITTMTPGGPGSTYWEQEREALAAADRHILVSRAQREHYENAHGISLDETSLIIPQPFARDTVAPPSPKLSDADGRTHLTLMGTAVGDPGHLRWYVDVIRRLVGLDIVVHSHFFEMDGISLDPYRELADELPDYHFHGWVRHRDGTKMSKLLSRYDLGGVFHEWRNASEQDFATLAVCLPTKAVASWLHAGMPTVSFGKYRGVAERVEDHGIGFLARSWDEVGEAAADRSAIEAATRRALDVRETFTCEHNAERISRFVAPCLA
jgi:hypothetical protein